MCVLPVMSCLTLWLLCVMVHCVFSSIALYNVVVVMCNVCKGGFLSCQFCLMLLLFLLFYLVSTEGFLLQLCYVICCALLIGRRSSMLYYIV